MPEPCEWIDTLPLARAGGLPGRLDELGHRLFGLGKVEQGAKTLLKITKPGRDGNFPTITVEQLTQVVRYNIQDVALLVGYTKRAQEIGERIVAEVIKDMVGVS